MARMKRNYVDVSGQRWVEIGNFWKLNATMIIKMGQDWKNKCLNTYGYEQLFLNKYNRYGRKI